MTFEEALGHMKQGHNVRRQAWPPDMLQMRIGPSRITGGILLQLDRTFTTETYALTGVDLLADDWAQTD